MQPRNHSATAIAVLSTAATQPCASPRKPNCGKWQPATTDRVAERPDGKRGQLPSLRNVALPPKSKQSWKSVEPGHWAIVNPDRAGTTEGCRASGRPCCHPRVPLRCHYVYRRPVPPLGAPPHMPPVAAGPRCCRSRHRPRPSASSYTGPPQRPARLEPPALNPTPPHPAPPHPQPPQVPRCKLWPGATAAAAVLRRAADASATPLPRSTPCCFHAFTVGAFTPGRAPRGTLAR